MQLFSHGVHTRWSSVVLFHPSCCPPLNLFQCLDIVGCEGIPNRAGILYYRSYECFVCCIFQPLIGDLNVAPEEAQGLVGFVADISDVSVPSQVRGDLNSQGILPPFLCSECDRGAGTMIREPYDVGWCSLQCIFGGGWTSSSTVPSLLGHRGLAVGPVGHVGHWPLCGRSCRLRRACRQRSIPLVSHLCAASTSSAKG